MRCPIWSLRPQSISLDGMFIHRIRNDFEALLAFGGLVECNRRDLHIQEDLKVISYPMLRTFQIFEGLYKSGKHLFF